MTHRKGGASAVLPLGIAVMCAFAVALTACSSNTSRSSSAASARRSNKAFCADDVALDKAFVSVDSPQSALAAAKANVSTIDKLAADIPTGSSVEPAARTAVAGIRAAIAANDASKLPDPQANNGAIDTYCRVDGEGNPLPSYFGSGASSTFCAAADDAMSRRDGSLAQSKEVSVAAARVGLYCGVNQ